MNQRQLASVLFTAVGVFIAAAHLPAILMQAAALTPSIPDLDDPVSPVNQRLMLVLGLMSSLVAVLIGSLLVVLRDRLANRLFPPATESLSSRELHAVALSVLGSYFVVQGLAHLARAGDFDWSGAIQLVLGVGLFFGARALSRLWAFGRSAGTAGNVGEDAV
jgi:hypothetical protein